MGRPPATLEDKGQSLHYYQCKQ